MSRRQGPLIGIEGVDAIGKQTQSSLLDTWLKSQGYSSSTLSFPDYETPIGQLIREFLNGGLDLPAEARHMLFTANRWEKAVAIERGRSAGVVIVNRYSESNLVYGMANGLPLNWLLELEQGLPKTDLVLVLDTPIQRLVSRRANKDSYEKNIDLQTKARRTYRRLASKFGWKIINATGDKDEVHRRVRTTIRKWLRERGVEPRP